MSKDCETMCSTLMPLAGSSEWTDADIDETNETDETDDVTASDNAISYNFTLSSRKGWECPRCGICLSPDIASCSRCAPTYISTPFFTSPTVWSDSQVHIYSDDSDYQIRIYENLPSTTLSGTSSS